MPDETSAACAHLGCTSSHSVPSPSGVARLPDSALSAAVHFGRSWVVQVIRDRRLEHPGWRRWHPDRRAAMCRLVPVRTSFKLADRLRCDSEPQRQRRVDERAVRRRRPRIWMGWVFGPDAEWSRWSCEQVRDVLRPVLVLKLLACARMPPSCLLRLDGAKRFHAIFGSNQSGKTAPASGGKPLGKFPGLGAG